MKRNTIFISLILFVVIASAVSFVHAMDSGKSWFAAGSEPKSYDMGITTSEHYSGKSAAYIKSIKTDINGFGTYMQMTETGEYLGKSVRMSGWIKSKDVKDWSGMWFRVDGEASKMLSFDNMQDRPITGTTDWKKYEITLDVPKDAKDLAFGVLLSGTGEVYFDDVNFEILGPANGKTGTKGFLKKPMDLNFED